MFGSCGRHVSLCSLLNQRIFMCPNGHKGAELRPWMWQQVRHSSRSGRQMQTTNPEATVLEESEPGRSRVRVTLSDNPGIIVCHHPPNKVRTRKFRMTTSPTSRSHITLPPRSEEGVGSQISFESPNSNFWKLDRKVRYFEKGESDYLLPLQFWELLIILFFNRSALIEFS
jgi:hypothetical protein